MMKTRFPLAPAMVLLLGATLAAPPSVTAQATTTGGLTTTISGNNIVLSFPTSSTAFYTVQAVPDLSLQWTNAQVGVQGDGTGKTFTVSNAISVGKGFYRLWIHPPPLSLLLPQSNAFAILGHSCGGIREQAYATGFDPTSGYPTGQVYLTTTCSTGGRGSPPATFSAWAAVTWDFAGNVISSATLSTGPAVNPTFTATDVYGDVIYNFGAATYLVVPVPAAPTGVTAVQSGDQFQVSWTANGVNPAAIKSSTLTATPVNSAASTLTTTVNGAASSGLVNSLQPQTTYEVTVVNTTIGGSSLASTPVTVTTVPATIPPSAPTGLTAAWASLNPVGTTDTLVARWNAADPGNSPVDQYEITINGSDGAGAFMQTVSGTTLTASFTVDYIPNWSVTVRAHNAAGWGSTASVTLGGL